MLQSDGTLGAGQGAGNRRKRDFGEVIGKNHGANSGSKGEFKGNGGGKKRGGPLLRGLRKIGGEPVIRHFPNGWAR